MQLAFILGSNPELSAQEITAAATTLPFPWNISMIRPGILGLKSVTDFEWEGNGISGFVSQEQQDLRQTLTHLQRRLGGTREICWLLEPVREEHFLRSVFKAITGTFAESSKWTIGGLTHKEGLQLKRELRSEGGNLRFIDVANDASIWHNHLDLLRFDTHHPALNVSRIDGKLAVTLTVQDVEEYSRRDFGIPVPDPASGMLPPKLAQAMINLAVGDTKNAIVYDPFCGNGRLLLEGQAMGFSVFGSDIVSEKAEASIKNLAWLTYFDPTYQPELRIWQADATSSATISQLQTHITSQQGLNEDEKLFIIAEPYLGQPLRRPLKAEESKIWLKELSPLYLHFLETWGGESFAGMLLIFPAAKTEDGEVSLLEHLFDRVKMLGYTPKSRSRYARPDAFVSRDLVSLTRI